MVLTICGGITVYLVEYVLQKTTKYLKQVQNGLPVSIDNISPRDMGQRGVENISRQNIYHQLYILYFIFSAYGFLYHS